MMLDEQQLSQLLRLKRFEQPPPGYFEHALDELHHRLHAGAEHRSGFFSRLQEFLADFRVPRAAYAGAFGIFLVVATLMGTGIWSPRFGFGLYKPTQVAEQNNSAGIVGGRIHLTALGSSQRQEIFPTIEPSDTGTPRYILGGQPVSYNSPSSF